MAEDFDTESSDSRNIIDMILAQDFDTAKSAISRYLNKKTARKSIISSLNRLSKRTGRNPDLVYTSDLSSEFNKDMLEYLVEKKENNTRRSREVREYVNNIKAEECDNVIYAYFEEVINNFCRKLSSYAGLSDFKIPDLELSLSEAFYASYNINENKIDLGFCKDHDIKEVLNAIYAECGHMVRFDLAGGVREGYGEVGLNDWAKLKIKFESGFVDTTQCSIQVSEFHDQISSVIGNIFSSKEKAEEYINSLHKEYTQNIDAIIRENNGRNLAPMSRFEKLSAIYNEYSKNDYLNHFMEHIPIYAVIPYLIDKGIITGKKDSKGKIMYKIADDYERKFLMRLNDVYCMKPVEMLSYLEKGLELHFGSKCKCSFLTQRKPLKK